MTQQQQFTTVAEVHGHKVVFESPEAIKEIFEKTKLKHSQVQELYKRIQPVVRDLDGDLCYMQRVNPFEVSFLWERSTSMTYKADGLIALPQAIATMHKYGYHGMFKPSVEEVFQAIAASTVDGKSLLDVHNVVAFETLGPENADDLGKQQVVTHAGYHMAKTILYVSDGESYFKRPAAQPEPDLPHPSIIAYPFKKEKDPRFDDTFYVVQASSNETQNFWGMFAPEGNLVDRRDGRLVVSWKQDSSGMWIRVGEVARMPVCVSIFWAIVGGKRVLFWEVTSQVAHFEMVESWLKKQCTNSKGFTDSSNFHHALNDISDATGKKLAWVKA